MPALLAVLDPSRSREDRERLVAEALASSARSGPVTRLSSHGQVTIGVSSRYEDDIDLAGPGGNADGAPSVGRSLLAGLIGSLDDPVPGSSRRDAAALVGALLPGAGVLPRLRGAFSAVVTDGHTLQAWRDHLGSLPLFHRAVGDRAWVSSEVALILRSAGLPREVDLDVVESIFYSTYDDDTPAALRGVARLPKATLLSVGPGTSTRTRYWDPSTLIETRGRSRQEDLQEEFDALMTQATRRAMSGADVVSLSGGVDSTAVAAFAAPQHLETWGRPLPALSAVYPRFPTVDESGWISLVADHLGMPLDTFEPSGLHLDELDSLGRLLDGPVPTVWFSEIDEFYRRAAALGYRRILTGECAEYVIEMRGGLVPYLVKNGRLRGAARFLAAQRRGGASMSTVLRSAATAAAPDSLLRAYHGTRRSAGLLTVPDFVDASRVDLVDPMSKGSRRTHWRTEQLQAFRGPGLSMEADTVVQDRHGVVVRRPWLDVDLWTFFLSLRAEDKFPGSRYKALVKSMLRGKLPDSLLDRRTFTSFSESVMSRVDYLNLRAWLLEPTWQMPGVDYARLADRLAAEDLALGDYIWAKDLATAHAFVAG